MQPDRSDGAASGFVCPTCDGALWERPFGVDHSARTKPADSLSFECHIGHAFEAAQLWVEQCATRNRALLYAARSLAENAALARRLARWTREHGDVEAATEL